VRLNLISTPHEPGVFQAVARVGSGLLDMPGNKPALKEFGLQTLLASGTAHYLANDLQAMVEQEFLAFDFGVDDHDAFTLQAAAETDHLDAFLGVVTEFLFKPKFGTYVHRSEKMKATLTRASSAMGMQEGMRDLTDHLFDGDARFMWGSFVDYVGLSRRDVERWLKQPFTRGYVEISIVGDINEEEALALATRTVGTLTPRAEEKKLRGPLKPLKLSAPPGFERIEFVGERHLALVRGYWPVEGELSDRDVAGLYLLATLLENEIRKEIRDELGLAYSPMADYEEYAGFSEFGMLVATVDCASESSTRIARIVEDIAVRLSRQGIDEGAFIGARGILSSQVRRAWRDNGFLLSQVMRAQERPAAVAEVQALHAGLIDEITQAEVEALARRVLNRRNTRTAALVPKQFIGIFQTE
jgi:zinc protease